MTEINTSKISAIKIQTDVPEIPIEIGKLNFSFSVSDENLLSFRGKSLEIQKTLSNLPEVEDDEEAMAQAKDALRVGFDAILGAGSFEKIYEQTPSINYLVNYLFQLISGITNVMADMGIKDKDVNRYTRRAQQKANKRK